MSSLPAFATRDRVRGAVLVVACGILQAAALAMAAFATRDAFAALHADRPMASRTLLELALSASVAAACFHLCRKQAEALGQSYAMSLRHRLYEKIAMLPKSRHERRRTGALSLRFVGDLSAARLWFGRGMPDVLTALVVLPGAVAILILLDPRLARAGLLPLGLSLVVMVTLAWHLETRHRRLRSRRASIAIDMIERIAIAPDLDLMGRTGKELRALEDKGASLKADAVARRGRTAGLQAIVHLGAALSGLTMLWLASRAGAEPSTVAAGLSVLALVALPLQDLGGAWDRYCAWRVAREKAQRLLDEPSLARRHKIVGAPLSVSVVGAATLEAKAGTMVHIRTPDADRLGRIIAGLDHDPNIDVRFGDSDLRPKIAYIGDQHIGLQGSLRRSATLVAGKRPEDARVEQVMKAFGLGDLLAIEDGLDQRIAGNGHDLTGGQTLRLDLARAVLGDASVVVIASQRWVADPDRDGLLGVLMGFTRPTIILAETTAGSHPAIDSRAL